MSFPHFPDHMSHLDPEEAAALLLASIAFEELSLAHIINAEAEKLQAALGTLKKSGDKGHETVFHKPLAKDLNDLLKVNRSVEKMLQTVIKKEMLLQFKFENVL